MPRPRALHLPPACRDAHCAKEAFRVCHLRLQLQGRRHDTTRHHFSHHHPPPPTNTTNTLVSLLKSRMHLHASASICMLVGMRLSLHHHTKYLQSRERQRLHRWPGQPTNRGDGLVGWEIDMNKARFYVHNRWWCRREERWLQGCTASNISVRVCHTIWDLRRLMTTMMRRRRMKTTKTNNCVHRPRS